MRSIQDRRERERERDKEKTVSQPLPDNIFTSIIHFYHSSKGVCEVHIWSPINQNNNNNRNLC